MVLPEFFRRLDGYHWRERRLAEMMGCEFKEEPEDPGAALKQALGMESEEAKFDQFWENVEARRKAHGGS